MMSWVKQAGVWVVLASLIAGLALSFILGSTWPERIFIAAALATILGVLLTAVCRYLREIRPEALVQKAIDDLRGDNPSKWSAAECVLVRQARRAIQPLGKLARSDALFHDLKHNLVRGRATHALCRIAREAPDWSARRDAVWELRKPPDAEAARTLAEAFNDADLRVSARAVLALGKMPTGDTRVSVGPLLNALQSESLRVRIYAVLALRMRQGPSRKARAALQEAQDHQDPDVQLLAKALLEKQGKQRRISELREVPNSPELKAKLSAEAMKAVCSVVSAANEKGLRPFQ